MGQYFRLINKTKKEYLDPWDLGGGAKLWEWCANNHSRIIAFLLRKSTESGGGDIQKKYSTAGSWAGDDVSLVGDYDESGDYGEAEQIYKNISLKAAQEFNDFIGSDEIGVQLRR